MDRFYIVFGFLICGLFVFLSMTSNVIFGESAKATKPTGQQRFHK